MDGFHGRAHRRKRGLRLSVVCSTIAFSPSPNVCNCDDARSLSCKAFVYSSPGLAGQGLITGADDGLRLKHLEPGSSADGATRAFPRLPIFSPTLSMALW